MYLIYVCISGGLSLVSPDARIFWGPPFSCRAPDCRNSILFPLRGHLKPGALGHCLIGPDYNPPLVCINNNDKIVAISNVVHKKKGNHYGDTLHWYIHVLYIKYENYYVENDVRSIHYRFIHAFMGWLRSPCIQLHPVF